MARRLGVIVILLILFLPSLWGNHPLPCCQIQFLEPSALPVPTELSKIYLASPKACAGKNIAKAAYHSANFRSVYSELCLNGYNIATFLISLLQELGTRAGPVEQDLLKALLRLQAEYSALPGVGQESYR